MEKPMNQHKKLAMGKMPASGGPAPHVKYDSPKNSKTPKGAGK